MRVPLSWLRDYVDIQLTPEQLAERLTLLGMEVKGLERWGADWENVIVGELLSVERHPRADRLSLTRVTVGSGEPLEIVCGATNIAPGQRVPVALPGAVLPGGRRIERTEKMGVTSNGMLCSGDELRLTADADGILILPPETPLGVPLVELYGDVVLDVDVKPNRGDALSMVGLAREVAAVTGAEVRFPETDPPEDGDADRGPAGRRGRGALALPAVRRASGQRRDDRAVAGPRADAAHRGRPAAGEQRRRRQQLRDAGARQADPYLRRRGRSRRPDHRPTCARGRAPRDARSRRTRARSGDPAHRRPRRAAGDRRRDGRSDVRSLGDHDRRHRGVGDLRPREHPPHGVPLRASLRGEPPVREGPGASTRAAGGGSDRPAHQRVGRRIGGEGRDRHEPGRTTADARALPAGEDRPVARRGRPHGRAARLVVPCRRGDRARAPRYARRRSRRAGPDRGGRVGGGRPRGDRSRPGAATS